MGLFVSGRSFAALMMRVLDAGYRIQDTGYGILVRMQKKLGAIDFMVNNRLLWKIIKASL
jgi:hypothetical protein